VDISARAGAPVKWLKIETLVGGLEPIFLLKNSPHPNAGKLLINFILSPAGQKVISNADYIPANATILPMTPDLTPEVGGFKYQMNLSAGLAERLDKWIAVYDRVFK
jgi:ABC-type Fe3+ transport system substrate-binding protein